MPSDQEVPSNESIDIKAASEDGSVIDDSMNEAVREAVLRHQQVGAPLAVWRDGRVQWIPASEIKLPESGAAALTPGWNASGG